MNTPTHPQLRLNVPALEHNIALMADWCKERAVVLAPHVKTTMSLPIIERQMAAGAVGVTVATVEQAGVLLAAGHRDVLIANQVVDPVGLQLLREALEADPQRTVRIFVDSAAGVAVAANAFAGATRPLEVLLDVGTPGGRTGVRTQGQAAAVAGAVAAAPELRLVGVAGYEGVVPNARYAATLAAVDTHCALVRDVFLALIGLFETDAPVFSMGGSAFPDRVVEFLPQHPGTVHLLRSGCYATHDHGTYAGVSPVDGLIPALTVRALVVSVPEDGLVVLGAGKRDLPYDAGLPSFLGAFSAAGEARQGATGRVEKLFDHHAVMLGASGLEVGDVVELGISHPCSVFDRWSEFLAVDGSGTVLDVWTTDFRRRLGHS